VNLCRSLPSFCGLLWACFFGCSSSPTLFSASGDAGSVVLGGSGDSEESGVGGVSSSAVGGPAGPGSLGAGAGTRLGPSASPAAGGAQGSAIAGGAQGSAIAGDGQGSAIAGGGAGGDMGQGGSDASAPSGTNVGDRCATGCCHTTDRADSVAATVLADSVLGFSGTQGRCGWSFGYLPLGLEPFTLLMVYGTTDVYSPTDGQTPTWETSTSHPPWLAITSTSQHPNSVPLAWIDRRWTSGVSGSIAIRGHVAKVEAGASGDGIRASIRVAGAQIWQASIAFNDTRGQDFSLNADVEVGTTLDFIVDPGPTDGHDTTTFTAVISR
jgi:hypothetical protein